MRGQTWQEEMMELRGFLGRLGVILRKQRRSIQRGMLLGLLSAVVWGIGTAPVYQAHMRLVPYRSTSMAAGGLSGLAGLAGVRLGTGSVGDVTITSEIYPEVGNTLDFLLAVSQSTIATSTSESLQSVDEAIADERGLWSFGSQGLPRGQDDATDSTPAAGPVIPRPGVPHQLLALDVARQARLESLRDRLTISFDKKTGIITLSGWMSDPVAAAALVQVTSDRLTERVVAIEVQKATEQLLFIERQYGRARDRYDAAQAALAEYEDRNRSSSSARGQIERDRMQREREIAFELFQQVSREREQALIKKNQDTPVFAVLEQVMIPTERSQPKVLGVVGRGVGLGVLFSLLAILAGPLMGTVRRRRTVGSK